MYLMHKQNKLSVMKRSHFAIHFICIVCQHGVDYIEVLKGYTLNVEFH